MRLNTGSGGYFKKTNSEFTFVNPFQNFSFPILADLEVTNLGVVFTGFSSYLAIVQDTTQVINLNSTINDIFYDNLTPDKIWIATSAGIYMYNTAQKVLEDLTQKYGKANFKKLVYDSKTDQLFAITSNMLLFTYSSLKDSIFFDISNLDNVNLENFVFNQGVFGYGLKVNGGGPEDCTSLYSITYKYVDLDMDSFTREFDCDDSNSNIYPGATDIPDNGIDENCNGADLSNSENFDIFNEVVIYPNPAYSTINIKSELSLKYRLIDRNGIELSQGKQMNIDVSSFISGFYILELTDLNSRKREYRKIKIIK